MAYCAPAFNPYSPASADLPRAVYEVNLENPVAFLTVFTEASHSVRVVGVNVQRDFVTCDSFVRELAKQMPRDIFYKTLTNKCVWLAKSYQHWVRLTVAFDVCGFVLFGTCRYATARHTCGHPVLNRGVALEWGRLLDVLRISWPNHF